MISGVEAIVHGCLVWCGDVDSIRDCRLDTEEMLKLGLLPYEDEEKGELNCEP